MFKKYRSNWCKRHGTTPPPDLRAKYIAGSGSDMPPHCLNEGTNLSLLSVQTNPRSPNPSSPQPAGMPDTPRDLMISYSHADKEAMVKLKDSLESNGITVWVDTSGLGPGVNFLSTIGQAIIDAKLFVSMVSRSSIKSKFCQDELALAYVSAKAIFPVALEDRKTLFPLMATDARLQLAGYKWTLLLEPTEFDDNFQELLILLKEELNEIRKENENGKTGKEIVGQGPHCRPGSSHRRKINPNISISIDTSIPETNPRLQQQPDAFWEESFHQCREIEWNRFWSEVCSIFESEMNELYELDRLPWLEGILRREMDVNDNNNLLKDHFLEFCLEEGDYVPVWIRMEEQAKESIAMEAVFNMDSSVRVEAIENLAKFKSPAVVDALQDLLSDSRADVRAVAAICMARIGSDQESTVNLLRQSLRDRDRLVREAGCIAIGKLKIQSALKELLHIWRNDVIADVRASAELALKQIGGPEVDREMKVTTVLSQEIRMLTKRN